MNGKEFTLVERITDGWPKPMEPNIWQISSACKLLLAEEATSIYPSQRFSTDPD